MSEWKIVKGKELPKELKAKKEVREELEIIKKDIGDKDLRYPTKEVGDILPSEKAIEKILKVKEDEVSKFLDRLDFKKYSKDSTSFGCHLIVDTKNNLVVKCIPIGKFEPDEKARLYSFPTAQEFADSEFEGNIDQYIEQRKKDFIATEKKKVISKFSKFV